LLDTAKKLGLEPLQVVGEKFDPNLHHAVDRVQRAEAEDDTVLDELQRGYNYRGRLLRPAMVRVAYKG
jgi:molecular chaperone GrpE